MAGECLVIALILGVLNIGFFRAKRKNWGLAVLPLGFVPLATGLVMYFTESVFMIQPTFLLPMIIIFSSMVVSCIWIGISTEILIKTKKMRIMYVAASVGFVFTFSLIMLIKYYFALLPA